MIQEGNLIKDLPWLSDVPVRIDRIERSFSCSQVECSLKLFHRMERRKTKRDPNLPLMLKT